MLTKTINVSGGLKVADGFYANISFNYRDDVSELNNIDFNFNKDVVNVFGSYNVKAGKITNYNVNNGFIDADVLKQVEALAAKIAENPENPEFYQPDDLSPVMPK